MLLLNSAANICRRRPHMRSRLVLHCEQRFVLRASGPPLEKGRFARFPLCFQYRKKAVSAGQDGAATAARQMPGCFFAGKLQRSGFAGFTGMPYGSRSLGTQNGCTGVCRRILCGVCGYDTMKWRAPSCGPRRSRGAKGHKIIPRSAWRWPAGSSGGPQGCGRCRSEHFCRQ